MFTTKLSKVNSDSRFSETEYAVEATSYEYLTIWEKFHEDKRTKTWIDETKGVLVEVGSFFGHPVCISCRWAKINEKNILFYEASSQVVYYPFVEQWLDENCNILPNEECGRLRRTNANNFHNTFLYCVKEK